MERKSEQPVPDELMEKLHAANKRFHEARKALEAQMAGSEYRHQERLDIAANALREAEKEVEAVTDQISGKLRGTAE